jgi:hypothetical protein
MKLKFLLEYARKVINDWHLAIFSPCRGKDLIARYTCYAMPDEEAIGYCISLIEARIPPPAICAYSGADKWKYSAVSEESTILTGCVDFDTSMNIRYGGICDNANSQKFGISDILL